MPASWPARIRHRTATAAVACAVLPCCLSTEAARAGGFDCMGSITNAPATDILGAQAQVVAGGGSVDDCGITARGLQPVTITGYVVKRSFFDRLRRNTRSGTRTGDGVRVEYVQRSLSGFGAPAFAYQATSYFENATPVTRAVFVYKHGRMLRPIATTGGPRRLQTLSQLVRIARVCARRI